MFSIVRVSVVVLKDSSVVTVVVLDSVSSVNGIVSVVVVNVTVTSTSVTVSLNDVSVVVVVVSGSVMVCNVVEFERIIVLTWVSVDDAKNLSTKVDSTVFSTKRKLFPVMLELNSQRMPVMVLQGMIVTANEEKSNCTHGGSDSVVPNASVT